ncbi:MAG: FAD-dependent oxidoreductase [Pyrinomonadaceae bacterium]
MNRSPNFSGGRLGQEVLDFAVDPFVSGIFAGSPDELSVKSAFPSLYKMEADYGSILKASAFGKKEKPGKFVPKAISRTVSFKNGMQTLTDKLAENLRGEIRIETGSIENWGSGKWKVESGK